ncbi:4-hydroxybenzoate octaprenyltransferase [Gluconacetobacter azotocaptans]|uniref:4-hydroxybenzoate octaprenyltransferase n=1 Tax=Gluconacetobacter azotocaptans TaxID=142834 RepID=UPI001958A932|nr:4-hydroxybenzoate octaprenyltransferase [Gluconacetobacter azotocaptans]MBM9402693.1 4-hydroxybenzoate octaprenyltransferase [Gluconacetobacter azotocaptans]
MSGSLPHTDIRAEGWIGRLPPALRPYALLARLDRPIGTWLLFLPGVWGILLANGIDPRGRIRLIVLFGVGSLVMRAAGCVVNDMWDRDIDRRVARTAGRPLASGALRMRQAAVFLLILLMIGLAILLCLNPLSRLLGASSLLLVALYPLAKRVTWWPQLVMGFTFGFGAPLGYAAAAGRIDAAWVALYAATILWQLGFDTIYGFQDMEDDARIGVKSTSRLWAGQAHGFVGACYALSLAALLAAGGLGGMGPGFWPAMLLPAAAMAWQVARLDIADPRGCLSLFRFNRETGLAVALALLAGLFGR